jgi:protein-S-isoprenylcysteine O-methyltransferase Ste14
MKPTYRGGAIVVLAIAIMTPLLRIKPLTRPDAAEVLHTGGVFRLVRHPGYFANTLWGLGWAVAFGSTIGVALTPAWAVVFWFHALIEEEALQREYGASYREYMAQVPCRLIPRVPL